MAEPAAARLTLDAFQRLLASHHPFAAQFGIEVIAIGAGTARALLPPRPGHLRRGGIIAGPMLMALADVALYAAVVGASGEPDAVTASLTINFLRKAPAGLIVAEARLLKTGRLCAGDVLLHPEGNDEPIAQAVSTWVLPRAAPRVCP
jgi:uncharacterized protein (TIGR00369 family)